MSDDWLLMILSDSALPTGGFVASAGLEAAVQSGHVYDDTTLTSFLSASLHTLASSSTSVLVKTWTCLDEDTPLPILLSLDAAYDALTVSNHVARRASRAQGVAYLGVLDRAFRQSMEKETHREVIGEFKRLIRVGW
ncbi:hypothetical protein HK104_009639 [Borealophlyctis nickersoniae]|nr:hypothetical protein HK104_009639 [Borealophlyctis nickersoniae]